MRVEPRISWTLSAISAKSWAWACKVFRCRMEEYRGQRSRWQLQERRRFNECSDPRWPRICALLPTQSWTPKSIRKSFLFDVDALTKHSTATGLRSVAQRSLRYQEANESCTKRSQRHSGTEAQIRNDTRNSTARHWPGLWSSTQGYF